MFDLLSEKIGSIFKKLSGKGGLTEKDIDQALREVRVALLEADVALKVVKEFTSRVRERVPHRRGAGEPVAGPTGGEGRP